MALTTDKIRNVVLLSHSGAGKTSLTEAILYSLGLVSRLGRVEDGTTTSDYDPDEARRKISLNLSIIPVPWKEHKINFLDIPGYADFVGEVKAALRVAEGSVIVVDATSGVQVGTEQAWSYAEEAGLPRLIFINKMDRENADFLRTLEDIRRKLGPRAFALQLPIGSHTAFKGIVDILSGKAYLGPKGEAGPVPQELEAQLATLREKLVEAVVETEEELLARYLEGEELGEEALRAALIRAVRKGQIVPVLAGSAFQLTGTGPLLESIVALLPSPQEVPGPVSPDPAGPLAALVFKTSADPYVGRLTYLRVYSGTLFSNSQAWNANKGQVERIGQLFFLRGKNQETTTQIIAGDIGAIAKLSVTATNDTLTTREHPQVMPTIVFPSTLLSLAVHPKTKADLDKMGSVLPKLLEEDPTLKLRKEPGTGETLLMGLGETHLGVAVERAQRKFGVELVLSLPIVPYKETISVPVKADYRHKKQTGGHGQFAHVYLELEPLPRGTGVQFEERLVGQAISRNYVPSVEKGVHEAALEGVLAHFPVIDVRAIFYDGKEHPVDSSDICFKIAGAGAFKQGLEDGKPLIVEPIMKMEVTVPEAYTGDVIADLNGKRARVLGVSREAEKGIVEVQVPLAEVQRYAIDLRSITQGRGQFSMTFSHYEELPPHVAQKIIAQRQAEKAGG
ncbi:MAG TPA: elongation factor G [Dehalococcoidia bacterium]|nr:elongation factor G [Dehalococcoidia bacterium]